MDNAVSQAPQSFRGRLFRQDSFKPKEQRILVLKTGIAGVQFHIENEEEADALRNIRAGTELKLYREPDNEHDQWAIAVYLTEDDMIGHIPRFKNETIARLMDAGKKFTAVADDEEEFSRDDENAEKEFRRAGHSPTENMSFPISVYMIEEG